MIVALLGAAWAGSLDLIDVGGLWGTPTNSEPTAVWFNPAAVASGQGTRLLLEVAPTFASFTFDRDHPVWGGEARYRYVGVVPFLGVATDAGVPGLGIGAAVFVPSARGGVALDPEGPGRTTMREGDIRTISASLSAAYQILGKVSLGASVTYHYGSWMADLDTEVATALSDELVAVNGGTQTDYYDDAVIEDPRYQADARFGPLIAHNVSFGVGVHARPHPRLELGVAYQHGWSSTFRGTVDLDFDCPPDSDTLGRFGAEDKGLCDADMSAAASVAYAYPKRVHAGVAVLPLPELRLEVFGGWVGWSVLRDFAIAVDDVTSANTTIDAHTAALLGKDRLWARDNLDTFFVGLDANGRVRERWRVGGRVTFDRRAVPDHALSANNFDQDTILVGAQVGYAPVPQLEIALSYTEKIGLARTVTTSAFDLHIDPALRLEDRYSYPSANGRYAASIHRVALSVRAAFDGSARRAKRAQRDEEEQR